jgi:hypothetical protein
MTVVKKVDVHRACGVCNRTLLLGERTTRYSPGDGEWVHVCALCTEEAAMSGWIREGSPTTPIVPENRRRRRLLPGLGRAEGRRTAPDSVTSEPMLRRLEPHEQAMLDAADVFNESPYRRTVAGIVKSLGEPRVSFLPLSGTNPEVVVTVAWDISWYQYRVSLAASGHSARLADRGYELEELDPRFQVWNASLDSSGRVVPDIPRV